jgi:hypothetical protein
VKARKSGKSNQAEQLKTRKHRLFQAKKSVPKGACPESQQPPDHNSALELLLRQAPRIV